jgi:hypothetical protein
MKLKAAMVAANARGNVLITLLPNECGPDNLNANAVPARGKGKSLKNKGFIFGV